MYFERISQLRIDSDKTQREIAAYLHMHPNVYSRYERGERELPLWALIRLADYYHTSTDYLLGRTENPAAYHA